MTTNELNIRNAKALNTIIANFAEDGVPADVLESFRQEAMESGYDLQSAAGTDWYTQRSLLAEWFRSQRAADRKARTVEFNWDFEEVGAGEFVKNVDVDGLNIENLHEFMQDNGLAATRALVKKLARKAGKIFKETTDEGRGKDFAFARIAAINEARRYG